MMGQPFTVDDVAFTYGLLQDDAFPGSPALKQLWRSVIIRPIDENAIEFELTGALCWVPGSHNSGHFTCTPT